MYLCYAVAQEGMYKAMSEGHNDCSWFITFVQFCVYSVITAAIRRVNNSGTSEREVPLPQYALLGALSVGKSNGSIFT